MKKLLSVVAVMAVAMLGVVTTPDEGSAVPAFARQTGQACFACHYQHIPKLNAFGRAFKIGGFTDAAVDLIEDDNLSIPANLPVAFILKYRFQKTTPKETVAGQDDAGTDNGEWQIPDETAIFVAGRAGEHTGYAVEWGGPYLSGKVIFPFSLGDTTVGLSVYSTEGAGPAYGIEPFNTGVNPMDRMFEHGPETSAAIRSGITTAAEGLTLYAGGDMFFAAVGLWGPAPDKADTGFDLSTYYRLAFTPTVADMNLMIGVYGVAGETKCVDCLDSTDGKKNTIKTEAFGVDAQLQGEVAGMPLEVQAVYATAGGDAPSDARTSNLYTKADGFSAAAELSLNPIIGVALGYGNYTNKSGAKDVSTNAVTVGLPINLAQNVTLRPEYTTYGDDGRPKDNKFTLMLFAGF